MLMKLPHDVLEDIAARARMQRKGMRLSQETLASRSGVSFGSVKRFEGTGKISLESLLKLAVILNTLKNFDGIFAARAEEPLSLDDILGAPYKNKKKKPS